MKTEMINGKEYEVVERKSKECENCTLITEICHDIPCRAIERDDCLNVKFIEIKEPEEKRLTKPSRSKPRNKYDREIIPGVYVDVYDILNAFDTGSEQVDHAVKKLLAPGQRGVKDRGKDIKEAMQSLESELNRIAEWGE